MAIPALDLNNLTPVEKLKLIDDIWATIDFSSFEESPDVDIELNRRLDRLDAEGPSGIPWESVKAEMIAR